MKMKVVGLKPETERGKANPKKWVGELYYGSLSVTFSAEFERGGYWPCVRFRGALPFWLNDYENLTEGEALIKREVRKAAEQFRAE